MFGAFQSPILINRRMQLCKEAESRDPSRLAPYNLQSLCERDPYVGPQWFWESTDGWDDRIRNFDTTRELGNKVDREAFVELVLENRAAHSDTPHLE